MMLRFLNIPRRDVEPAPSYAIKVLALIMPRNSNPYNRHTRLNSLRMNHGEQNPAPVMTILDVSAWRLIRKYQDR